MPFRLISAGRFSAGLPRTLKMLSVDFNSAGRIVVEKLEVEDALHIPPNASGVGQPRRLAAACHRSPALAASDEFSRRAPIFRLK